jgi:hypothetical protein
MKGLFGNGDDERTQERKRQEILNSQSRRPKGPPKKPHKNGGFKIFVFACLVVLVLLGLMHTHGDQSRPSRIGDPSSLAQPAE